MNTGTKILSILTVILTLFGVGISVYAYCIDKASLGNLVGVISLLVGLIGTLSTLNSGKEEKTTKVKSEKTKSKNHEKPVWKWGAIVIFGLAAGLFGFFIFESFWGTLGAGVISIVISLIFGVIGFILYDRIGLFWFGFVFWAVIGGFWGFLLFAIYELSPWIILGGVAAGEVICFIIAIIEFWVEMKKHENGSPNR